MVDAQGPWFAKAASPGAAQVRPGLSPRAPDPNVPPMHRLAAAGLSSFLLLGCQDYPYRHEISGRVVGPGEVPLAGAVVQKVDGNGEAYGNDEAYRRTTDGEGRFSFVAEGRGPSPLGYAPWILRVTSPKYAERLLEVRAAWSEDRSSCYGYCAKDLTIDLK